VTNLRKLARSVPWWGWIIVAFLVVILVPAIIGAFTGSSPKYSKAPAPLPAAKTQTPTMTHAASTSSFQCRAKSLPQICSIAQQSFDRPLAAFGPAGNPSDPNFHGIDYYFAVDPNQSAEAIAVNSEASIDGAFEATVRQLQGQFNYVTGTAYPAGGTDPLNANPLLSTSIGAANIAQIENGADPIDIWRLDLVDPSLQEFVRTP
jgi:hypothetical protein